MPTTPKASRTIAEQIEIDNLLPGGIDTCISDLICFQGEQESIAVVGIDSSGERPLGRWTSINYRGQTVPFMPVARIDRTRKRRKLRLPDSFAFIAGTMKYRRQLPAGPIQTHRIETGFVLGLGSRREIIQFIHNNASGLTGRTSESSWRSFPKVYTWLESRILRRASKIVVFNKEDGERLSRKSNRVKASKTWYNPDVFHFTATPPSPKSVIWVGRLEEQKNPLFALDVLRELLLLEPGARMTVVGDGSFRAAMEDKARNVGVFAALTFAGALPRDSVADAYREHAAMLMTSHFEGSPRVLFESCASGTPVVATAGADQDSILDGFQNGIRVQSPDARQLAEGLLEVFKFDRQLCSISMQANSAALVVPTLLRQTQPS
ncbi:glycosyltransferase [Demequina sp. NBRC 110055]|uniref:glycosyltransferase n=1 Tax=Demequina sp. NBRC 110055 TaxID=1570344 RepID=UPI001186EF64|nr:glycosyltransferase [Demequina sp. NBRC 110055]